MYVVFSQRQKVKSSPVRVTAYLHKNIEINRRRFVTWSKVVLFYFPSKNLPVILLCVCVELPPQISSCGGFVLFSVTIASCLDFACPFQVGVRNGDRTMRVFFNRCSWLKILSSQCFPFLLQVFRVKTRLLSPVSWTLSRMQWLGIGSYMHCI